MTPASAAAGSTFVFETNLGAPSDLSLYRNGRLVRTVHLAESGAVRYEIATRASDAGAWRAHAEVRGQPQCSADATFTVLGLPDTATAPLPSPPGLFAGLTLLAIAGALAIWLRVLGHQTRRRISMAVRFSPRPWRRRLYDDHRGMTVMNSATLDIEERS
jgi:hypothetical protein